MSLEKNKEQEHKQNTASELNLESSELEIDESFFEDDEAMFAGNTMSSPPEEKESLSSTTSSVPEESESTEEPSGDAPDEDESEVQLIAGGLDLSEENSEALGGLQISPSPEEETPPSTSGESQKASSEKDKQGWNQELNYDFLKVPNEDSKSSSDILNFNISSEKKDEQEAAGTGTLELDIRSTNLWKGNKKSPVSRAGKNIPEELRKEVEALSDQEAVCLMRHFLNFDLVSSKEAKETIEDYFEDGQEQNNLLEALIHKGYITYFQYRNLKENLDRDKKAGRVQKVKAANQKEVKAYLGLAGNTQRKIVKLVCPYCKANYRLKVAIKPGKFKCGKCQRYFFLTGKKKQ